LNPQSIIKILESLGPMAKLGDRILNLFSKTPQQKLEKGLQGVIERRRKVMDGDRPSKDSWPGI